MTTDLDHIVWICSDLDRASRRFEALTGCKPHYGGKHEGGLTHNALVPLDGRCYIEIFAPTGAAAPNDDQWLQLARTACEPRVLTYCLRSPRPLAEIASIASDLRWDDAVVTTGGRTTPQGTILRWQLVAPSIREYGLSFPFFIDWFDSPHPAESSGTAEPGKAIRLQRFAVGHPDANGLNHALQQFGASVDTYIAGHIGFEVSLETPNGVVSL